MAKQEPKRDREALAAKKKRNVVAAVKASGGRTLTGDDVSVRRMTGGGRGIIGVTRRIADGDGRDMVIQVDDDPWDGYSRHDMDANDMIQTVDMDPSDPA